MFGRSVQFPDSQSMHKVGLWCSLSAATSSMKSGCFQIWGSFLVVYCLQSCKLPYIFLLRSYFFPFPPLWGMFSCRALRAVSLKQFYGVPQKHAFVKLPQSIIQREPLTQEMFFFCLALRCYLHSSKMQLAPSTSLSCFVWSKESSENQGRPHT